MRLVALRLRDRFKVGSDRGSAVIEFALVAPLVLLVFIAIVQISIAAYVRTTLIACAAEGARAGALADGGLGEAKQRTKRALETSVVGGVVKGVDARRERVNGVSTIAVTIDATLPVFGLLGPTQQTVEGHALAEDST